MTNLQSLIPGFPGKRLIGDKCFYTPSCMGGNSTGGGYRSYPLSKDNLELKELLQVVEEDLKNLNSTIERQKNQDQSRIKEIGEQIGEQKKLKNLLINQEDLKKLESQTQEIISAVERKIDQLEELRSETTKEKKERGLMLNSIKIEIDTIFMKISPLIEIIKAQNRKEKLI